MRNRRFLLVLAVALAALWAGANLVPDPDEAPKPVLRPPERADPAGDVLRAELPRDEVVRARPGQLVELIVRADRPVAVEIPQLGELELAAPRAPARFTLLLDRRETVAVRYDDGTPAGELEVR